ncbi:MAG: site-specific integrase [Nevskia sp.]|nr:site-specific integrase [Nevskia sp.]
MPPLPASPGAAALAAARDYAAGAYAEATRRAYRADWADFLGFCRAAGFSPLPAAPQTIAAYLASMAVSHAASTIARRLAAIGQAHRLAGWDWQPSHPAIRATRQGIARAHGSAVRRAAALTTAEIRKLVASCADDLTGLRDRALILVGFAGALRRGELVGVDREHLVFRDAGLRLTIPRSKTDSAGEGAELGIPRGSRRETCPVRALEAWLAASDCQFGPVFRKVDLWGNIEHARLHPDAVRQILRRRAVLAGLEVPPGERLSPHGLRAGFVTEAYMAGARDEQIMAHTRHADLKTMRGYVRRAKLLTESPAGLLGL